MQMAFDFYSNEVDKEPQQATIESLKAGLEEYIKISGLVAYKDFYMRLKNGQVLIPQNISKESYLDIAKEVYQTRAEKIDRDKNRRKYFAIRNKNKAKK